MPMASHKVDFVPKQGSIDDLFERLSHYINEVDSEWINTIVPADKESVELLKRSSRIGKKGHDIPQSYSVFLNHMGNNDGGVLSRYLMASTCVTEVCEYYREAQKYEPEIINPDILVFALSDMAEEISLDLRQTEEPKIIESSDGEYYGEYSESFEKLLFQSAFMKCEELRFPFSESYGGSQNMLNDALLKNQVENIFEVIDEIAGKENFSKTWFSDFRHYFGYRNDLVFTVEKKIGIAARIFGMNKNSISSFGEKLSVLIGVH